jgi:RNA polymerase sigma-70 factor (ECF subfamily)
MSETWKILEEARRGSRGAWEDLVSSQSARIFSIAYRVTGDADIAEDVVQETFLRVLESRAPLRERGAARSWIVRVAVRLSIDHLRRDEARLRREEKHAMAENRQEETAEGRLVNAELSLQLAEGLASLPGTTRAALWLHLVEGEPAREIAECLGCRKSSVYRMVEDGLDRMRRFLRRRGSSLPAIAMLPDVLRGLPGPPLPAALLERIRELPGSASLREGISTSTSGMAGMARGAAGVCRAAHWSVLAMSGKKLASIAAPLAILLLGIFYLADPQGWRSGGRNGSAVHIGKEKSPALISPVGESGRGPDRPGGRRKETPAAPKVASGAAEPYGSLIVRVRWGEDGTPAEGIGIHIVAWGDPDPYLNASDGVTDSGGEFRLDKVRAGEVKIDLDRSTDIGRAEIKPGQASEVELEVRPGIAVDGIVLDGISTPVPGAQIWLGVKSSSDVGHRVGEAGSDGTFALRSVERGCWIGARAPGHAASYRQRVEPAVGCSTASVKIVLPRVGSSLIGRVLDPEMKPVPGALVQTWPGKYVSISRMLEDGTFLAPPGPHSFRTDREGRFQADDIHPGEICLAVQTGRLATWRGAVEVAEGESAEIEIVLEEGATLFGKVQDAEGKPPAVDVRVGVGSAGNFLSHLTHAAPDGSYRLSGLAAGEIEAWATSDGGGEAKTKLAVEPGGEARWDPDLSLGLVIRGRVVDDTGESLQDWIVTALDEDGTDTGWEIDGNTGKIRPRSSSDSYQARAGSDGRFRLSNLKDHDYRLTAHDPEAGFPSAWLEEIRPGGDDVLLRVPREARPSANIQGAILDPVGNQLQEVTQGVAGILAVHLATGSRSHKATEQDGSFRLGPLPPGRYRLQAELAHFPELFLGEHDLAPGQVLDLGGVPARRGGFLIAKLLDEVGKPFGQRVHLDMWDSRQIQFVPLKFDDGTSTARAGPCSPGSYILAIGGRDGVACAEHPLEIVDGETTELEVVVKAGVKRTLVFRAPAEAKSGRVLQFKVLDGSGNEVLQQGVRMQGSKPVVDLAYFFAPGSYRIEASTDSGLKAEGTFEVRTLAEPPADHPIELR